LHGHGLGWDGSTPKMNDKCCGTLIPSKLWNLKIEDDPLAEGQRWYCWQHHRYNSSHGQVVEFRTVGGSLMYARASIPSGTIQDIRAIAIEEKVGHLGPTHQQIGENRVTLVVAKRRTVESGGVQTGRPQTDNVCRITGGASRLTTGG
jgi:hypothetical protein